MKYLSLTIIALIICSFSLINAQITITTTSSDQYIQSPSTSIYPAYVDNLEYRAWDSTGGRQEFQLKATGGATPYSWSIINGNLPTGLVLSADGKIYGIPSTEGDFTFTVKVVDNNNLITEKSLLMQAKPFRAKWFQDAKFGYMIQWGPFCTPKITTGADIINFENRIVNFNANTWATEMKSRGVKVFNFTVMGGDGIRLWPSTTPTVNQLKTKRNIVQELITACHQNGIKFIAYMPLCVQWSRPMDDFSSVDNTYSTMNIGLIAELIDMGVDGFWFDSCGSVGELTWMNWDKAMPTIRSKNPDIIFGSNPVGLRTGFLMQYPNADITFFEGPIGYADKDLGIAIPGYNKKKMVQEVDNLLTHTWVWDWALNQAPQNVKSSSAIINSIKQNWALGATFMLNFPVHTDGTFINTNLKSKLDVIADFVKTNIDMCETPQISLSENQTYTSPQSFTLSSTAGANIYYTLDGTTPTETSSLYSGSVTMKNGFRLRALAMMSGKGISVIADYKIKIDNADANLFPVHATNPSTFPYLAGMAYSDYYMGMMITTGRTILKLQKVGRPTRVNNSKIHRIKIVEVTSREIVSTGEIDMSKAVLENGFKYGSVSTVILKPFTSYYILCAEDGNDGITHGGVENVVGNFNLKIVKPVWTDISGTKYYMSESRDEMYNWPYMPSGVIQDCKGELLNLKVEPIDNAVPENIALGKVGIMENAAGKQLPPSSMIHFGFEATDTDSTSFSAPGGSWDWTYNVDLGNQISSINEVLIYSPKNINYFATEFEIWTSADNITWSQAASIKGNTSTKYGAKINPIDARYVRVRSLKPNAEGQLGVQMSIGMLEIKSLNKTFGATARMVDDALVNVLPKVGIRFASNALDGDTATFACADQKWNFIIDLKQKSQISKMNIDFSKGKHPEDFKITYTEDGATWSEIKTIKCFTGGRCKLNFPIKNVKSIQFIPLTAPREIQISNIELL